MADYTYFNYSVSEALLMSDEQRLSIVCLLEQMRQELRREEDVHTLRIVTSQVEQVLELAARYYSLQLSISAQSSNSDLLPRFEQLLRQYYAQQLLISGATITETSEQLGFDYPQHFTRQFKKHFGLIPSEFIRK